MIALLLTLGLLLIRLPSDVAGISRSILVAAALASFWAAIVLILLRTATRNRMRRSGFQVGIARLRRTSGVYLLFSSVIGLLVVAVVRASIDGLLKAGDTIEQITLWPTILIVTLVLTLVPDRRRSPDRLVWIVVQTSGWFLIANVVLSLMGLEYRTVAAQAGGAPAEMLRALGIQSSRHGFPLGSGVNGVGIAGGVGVVLGALFLLRISALRSRRLLSGVMACAGLAIMLQTDSRAALVFASLSLVVCALAPWRWLALLKWTPLVSPLLPLAILGITAWIGGTKQVIALSRTSGDFATANGRQLIWGGIATELAHFRPEHLVGYGFLGTSASWVVHSYSSLFGATFDETRLTAHNVMLQNVLDIGYFGALLFVLMSASALGAAASVRDPRLQGSSRVVLGGMLFLLLAGSTEASPTIYQPENFLIYLLLAGTALFLRISDKELSDIAVPSDIGS